MRAMTPGRRVLVLLLLSAVPSFADTGSVARLPDRYIHQPLWEVGVTLGFARIPLYRGCEEYSVYGMPLPYFIYRGERFESDKEGLKGIFVRTKHFETAFSVFGNPPVYEHTAARDDMPKLDPLVEFGPAAKWFFWRLTTKDQLYLMGAARGVVSAGVLDGVDLEYEGLHGAVSLNYNNNLFLGRDDMTAGMTLAADFGDRGYSRYYYDVSPQYATPDRREYEADAGYMGCSVSANVVKHWSRKFKTGAYVRWDNCDGTAYANSPLVDTHNNYVLACAFIYEIGRSKKLSRVKVVTGESF